MPLPTIMLVDDHLLFREGLKSLIKNEKIGIIIGEASNGREFLSLLEKEKPDLVLMDIDMPLMNGAEATSRAIEQYPDLNILVLSMHGDEGHYYNMINAGVKGFLLKTADVEELEKAINLVFQGENYFSNKLLCNIISEFGNKNKLQKAQVNGEHFTPRELEVMKLICSGLTNEEIAEKMFLSPKTIKGHRINLLRKTKCKNTPSMIVYIIKNKIIVL